MRWSFHQMSIAEFAAFEQSQGQRIIKTDGLYWTRVRPLFYRPFLPYVRYEAEQVSPPGSAWFGACQYAVRPTQSANSFLNLLIFETPQLYSPKRLGGNERREIRRAGNVFQVQQLFDADEFKRKAFHVYLSFYERTGYQYKTERQTEQGFSKWADAVFHSQKAIVLGAFKENGHLCAIGIWHLVENTLIYSSFFCDTESMRKHVAGLMLHAMREAVVEAASIKQIFVGMRKLGGRSSVDDFYLIRGCTLVRQPAVLHLNPVAKLILSSCLPTQYQKLRGHLDGEIKPGTDPLANCLPGPACHPSTTVKPANIPGNPYVL